MYRVYQSVEYSFDGLLVNWEGLENWVAKVFGTGDRAFDILSEAQSLVVRTGVEIELYWKILRVV
jgi:hypothetical protein